MWVICIASIHLSQHICTVRGRGSFISYIPSGMMQCCTHSCRDIYGHMQEVKDVPRGLRASRRLKRTGENAYFHFGIHIHWFHMSFSVYPSVTLLLSPLSLSLPVSFRMGLCFIFLAWSPHTLSSSIRISWCLLLCSYCLSFRHAGTNTHTHNTAACLFTASLGDHPLAISGQALSHDAPQYTAGYQNHLIPSLIWLD